MEDPSTDDIPVENVKKTEAFTDWNRLYENVNAGLFKRKDGTVMTFHFKIDDVKKKERFEELIILYGGDAVSDFVRMKPQTALMVEDNCKVMLYSRPSFKTSFIIDCITKNTLLDISDYLHNKITFKSENYMDILFLGRRNFNDEESSSNRYTEEPADVVPRSQRKKQVNKGSRAPFSLYEKEAMLKYILLKRKLSGFRGDSIWKSMEKHDICPKRTYQSMKNHFLKTLLYELDKFEFLTEKEKTLLRSTVTSK